MVGQPLIIIPGDEDQARGYRVKKFKATDGSKREFNNYACIYCQFSTLWLEGKNGMLAHQAAGDHPWAYPGQYPAKEPTDLSGDPEY